MNERLLYTSLRIVVSILGVLLAAVGFYVAGHSLGAFPPVQIGPYQAASGSSTRVDQRPANTTVIGQLQDPLWQGEPDMNTPTTGDQENRGVVSALPAETNAGSVNRRPAVGPLTFRVDLRNQPLPRGLVWTFAGIVIALTGLALILLAFRRVEGSGKTVVLQGLNGVAGLGGGRVTVSMQSLHAMAETLAERVPGVREASASIKLKHSGWHIGCHIAHGPEDSLPDIALDVRQKLTAAFEHQTGLPVARIDIAGRLGLQDARRRVS